MTVHLVTTAALNHGGLGRVTWRWAQFLSDRGVDVVCHCTGTHDMVETPGVSVVEYGLPTLPYYVGDLYFSRMVDSWREKNADPEDVWLAWSGLAYFLDDVDVVHTSTARPLYADLGTGVHNTMNNVLYGLYDYHRVELERSGTVVTPAPKVAEDIGRCYGVEAEVVPHGVDEQFRKREPRFDGEYFLMVGATHRKGIDRARRIMRKYSGSEPLKVVGYGDVGSSRRNIEYEGYVDDDRLIELYRNAKALLVPSREDGFCLPAAEALSLGTPPVMTYDTAFWSVLDDDIPYAGNRRRVSDYVAVRRISRLMGEVSEWPVERWTEYVRENLTWGRAADELLEVLMQ